MSANIITQLPSTGILLTDTGFYRFNTTLHNLGDQNELIRQAAQSVPCDVHLLGRAVTGNNVHLQASNALIVLYTRLPHLVLKTTWTPYDDGKRMAPCWTPGGTSTPIDVAPVWRPPEDMGLYFISSYSTAAKPGATVFAGSYLVAVKRGDGRFYRLPTGNVNDGGNICMGHAFRSNEMHPLMDRFNAEIGHFLESPWNHDLLRSEPHSHKALFSFLSDGTTQCPVDPTWNQFCVTMNNRVYANLPLARLAFPN